MVNSARRWIGVTLLATLVIGVGVGILVDRLLLAPTVHSRSRDVGRGGRDGHHRDHGNRMVERLRSHLDLNDEQTARLEGVMNSNHEKAREFWSDSRAEYDTLREQFRADIRAELTDEQQIRFDEMVAQYEAKRNEEKGRRSR